MFYPINLDIRDQPCLVVGGGPIALRKTRSLIKSKARVTVVSLQFISAFKALKVTRILRAYKTSDLTGKILVIAATNNENLHHKIYSACRKRNILVNIVDVPDLCTFILPAIIRRGDLAVTLSTGGASPALSKQLRKELESHYPQAFKGYVKALRSYRARIREKVSDPRRRKKLFESLTSQHILNQLRTKGFPDVRKQMDKIMSRAV